MGLDAFPSELATPVAVGQVCKQGWWSEGRKEKRCSGVISVRLVYFSSIEIGEVKRRSGGVKDDDDERKGEQRRIKCV